MLFFTLTPRPQYWRLVNPCLEGHKFLSSHRETLKEAKMAIFMLKAHIWSYWHLWIVFSWPQEGSSRDISCQIFKVKIFSPRRGKLWPFLAIFITKAPIFVTSISYTPFLVLKWYFRPERRILKTLSMNFHISGETHF